MILGFFLAPSGNIQAANCVDDTSPSADCGGLQWRIGVSQVITVPVGVTVTASSPYVSGVQVGSPTPGATLIVEGSIRVASDPGSGIENYGTIASIVIVNSGTISSAFGGGYAGIHNRGGYLIGTITNRGIISGGASQQGIFNEPSATITTLTDAGTISGGLEGIRNVGTIGTLNNLSSSLSLQSNLSTVYNVIVDSAASYGKLIATVLNGGTARACK